MQNCLLVLVALCLVACGSPLSSTPLPTPVNVFLSYPPYLQPAADWVIECAGQNSRLALFLNPVPAMLSDLPGTLLELQLGESGLDEKAIYQVGVEEIQVIVNAENPLSQLTTEQLLAIYSGTLANWDFGNQRPILVWTYPPQYTLRMIFETALPGSPGSTTQANIAPDPLAVISSIASDITAIGYVPGSYLESIAGEPLSGIKVLALDAALTKELTQPILAGVTESLSTEMQALLFCLQNRED